MVPKSKSTYGACVAYIEEKEIGLVATVEAIEVAGQVQIANLKLSKMSHR